MLGARVAQQSSRWSDITHIVCVIPELLDPKLREAAQRRRIPVVTVQWLSECFATNARQPETRFSLSEPSAAAPPPPARQLDAGVQPTQSFAATVLAGHDVLISPSVLGSRAQLPQMAEELGASVHTWRSAEELKALLEHPNASSVARAAEPGCAVDAPAAEVAGEVGRRQTVVLLDREEASDGSGPLASFIAGLGTERRSLFVLAAWLSETFRQRRRLPLENFGALPAEEPERAPPKRPRLGEAVYAWEPPGWAKLEELAEDSRARAMQSKVQEKVNEGLRLVQLRRQPSCLGG